MPSLENRSFWDQSLLEIYEQYGNKRPLRNILFANDFTEARIWVRRNLGIVSELASDERTKEILIRLPSGKIATLEVYTRGRTIRGARDVAIILSTPEYRSSEDVYGASHVPVWMKNNRIDIEILNLAWLDKRTPDRLWSFTNESTVTWDFKKPNRSEWL